MHNRSKLSASEKAGEDGEEKKADGEDQEDEGGGDMDGDAE